MKNNQHMIEYKLIVNYKSCNCYYISPRAMNYKVWYGTSN
jgi:hypothetical protein